MVAASKIVQGTLALAAVLLPGVVHGAPTPGQASLDRLSLAASSEVTALEASRQRDAARTSLLTREAESSDAASKDALAKSVDSGARADSARARAHEDMAKKASLSDELQVERERVRTIGEECARERSFLGELYAKRSGDEARLRDAAYAKGKEETEVARLERGGATSAPSAPASDDAADLLFSDDEDEDAANADIDAFLDVGNGDDEDEDEDDVDEENDDDEEEDNDDDDADDDEDDDDDADEDGDVLASLSAHVPVVRVEAEARLDDAKARRRAIIRVKELDRIIDALRKTIAADRKREIAQESRIQLCERRREEAKTKASLLESDVADATRDEEDAREEATIDEKTAAKDELTAKNAADRAAAFRQEAAEVNRDKVSLEIEENQKKNEARVLKAKAAKVGRSEKEAEAEEAEHERKEKQELEEAARKEEAIDKKIADAAIDL